jgi:hypothetical protein
MEDGKKLTVFHGIFCKKILGLARSAANNVAEVEVQRESRRGKVLCVAMTY